MKVSKMVLGGVLVAGMMMATGCMNSYPITRTASNIPVEQGKYTVVKQGVSGTSDQWFGPYGLSLDFSGNESPQRVAVEDALSKAPGADALVNITTDTKTLNIFCLIMRHRTLVTADAVKLND